MSDKEKIELLDFLKEMILKYPNDQELGKEIRKYYLKKDKKIKSE
jgi:phage anti-repressor protein